MRKTKVYSISMPPEMAKQAEKLAKKENRTMSELFREALRRYQQQEEQRPSSAALEQLSTAIELFRQEARRKGLDKMTMREINTEVEVARKEMRAKAEKISHRPRR